MFVKMHTRVFSYWIVRVLIVLLALGSFGTLVPVWADPSTALPVEPDAGSWTTWVLDSGSQVRLPAPPDEAASAEEILQLIEMTAGRDDAALQQIAYWDTGAPAYRWNQIAMDELLVRAMPAPAAFRNMALLNVAIYDATIAAWDSKYTHNRPRPSEIEPELTTVIPNPSNPSYPSEYAVTAGAASTVLAWLFPEKAGFFQEKAQEAANSRLLAGVEYPGDVEAGLELGRQVAELVIAHGDADGFSAPWTGNVPAEPGQWTGENPAFVTAGTWQPWVLTSPDQFRPAPPPAYDSEQMKADMDEVRTFERTPVTNSIAMFWEFGAGGRRIHWFWNSVTSRLILEARLDDNPPLAARAYALSSIASYEATVAVFDAKYAYWAIRPFQLEPEFSPVFTTPNHPSYPSAHSAMSMATARVLAYLFPTSTAEVMALAQEASESRVWGGIHFRTDIVVGTSMGQAVGDAVIEHAMGDGSQ